MVAETYYDGKLLRTDYYMTEKQWKRAYRKELKESITRKIESIKRKILVAIVTAIVASGFLFLVALVDYASSLL